LGVDAAGFIEQHLRGLLSVEGRVQIDPLAATDGEQGAFLAQGALGADIARVVGRMGRVGVIQHYLAPLHVGFEHRQFLEKVGLGGGIGLASCMVPENSGVSLGAAFKADLWEKYHMAAPRQRRQLGALSSKVQKAYKS